MLFLEALYCKLEGYGFNSRWGHWVFYINFILMATLWSWDCLSCPIISVHFLMVFLVLQWLGDTWKTVQ